jgi:hypothetical protein
MWLIRCYDDCCPRLLDASGHDSYLNKFSTGNVKNSFAMDEKSRIVEFSGGDRLIGESLKDFLECWYSPKGGERCTGKQGGSGTVHFP